MRSELDCDAIVLRTVRARGLAPITGGELQGVTRLSPEELNAAVSRLEERRFVEVLRYGGTWPFEFANARVTEAGRGAPQPWFGPSPLEQLESLREELRAIPSEPDPDDVPRFAERLRASRMGPSEVEALLAELPPPGESVSPRDERLRSVVESLVEERARAEVRAAASPARAPRSRRRSLLRNPLLLGALGALALGWLADSALDLGVAEQVAALFSAPTDVASPPPPSP